MINSYADLQSLNSQQYKVATALDTPCCVVAIPGSGKTKTIIEKLVHILTGHITGLWRESQKVMAVTFTSESAKELSRRAGNRLSSDLQQNLQTGTFHSLFFMALKRVGSTLASRQVASPDQARQYCLRAYMNRQPHVWRAATSFKAKDHLVEQMEAARINGFDLYAAEDPNVNEEPANEINDVVEEYSRLMAAANLLDFNMILEESLRFLKSKGDIQKNNDTVRMEFQRLAGYEMDWPGELGLFINASRILVDEAQDIDMIQLQILLELVNEGCIVDLVGDDDQSIYKFRNSLGYDGIKTFCEITHAKLLFLTVNYRCNSEILNLAEQVINNNRASHRTVKTFTSHRGSGGVISLNEFMNGTTELAHIHAQILSIKSTSKTAEDSMAIIARNNKTLDVVQQMFLGGQLEYERLGGASILSREPICFFISFLERLSIPDDKSGFEQCLYWSSAHSHGKIKKDAQLDIFNKLSKVYNHGRKFVNSRDPSNVKSVIASLGEWFFWVIKTQVKTDEYRDYLSNKIQLVMRLLLKDIDTQEDDAAQDTDGIAKQVRRDPQSISNKVRAIKQLDRTGKKEQKSLKIVTMHGSKGLEFDHVWIVGLDDQCIPGVAIHSDDDHNSLTEKLSQIEEERRLLYVSITRAKSNLHLSWSRKSIQKGDEIKRDCVESQFLSALSSRARPGSDIKTTEYYKKGLETV